MHLIIIILLVCLPLLASQPVITSKLVPKEMQKLNASNGYAYDYFGTNVAINETMMIVGTPGSDGNGSASGSAYLFEKNATGYFVEVAKLTAFDAEAGDNFGHRVAVDDNLIAVGSPGDDENGSQSGSLYLYERDASGDFSDVIKFMASDAATNGKFGIKVALDGGIIVAGATMKVYVFEKNATTDEFYEIKLIPTDVTEPNKFGVSVAISGDIIVVGADLDSDKAYQSGSIYVYEKNAFGSFVQTAKLTASDGDIKDYFGYSVDIYGDTIVVGARGHGGQAYVFEKNALGTFEEVSKLTPADIESNYYFGATVAIDGDHIVVGDHFDDERGLYSGAAYVFKKNVTGNFVQLAKLTASDEERDDWFGESVDINGKQIVIGAVHNRDSGIQSGSAYVFQNVLVQDVVENQTTVFNVTALDEDGDTISYNLQPHDDTSHFSIGLETGVLQFMHAPNFENPTDVNTDNMYETLISISDYGESDYLRAYIRVNNQFYEGTPPDALSFLETQLIMEPNINSVAIEDDTMVVGVPYGNKAYVYTYNNTSNMFEKKAELISPDYLSYKTFGSSVSISGNTIAIGAPKYSTYSLLQTGAVYTFEKPSTGWSGTVQGKKIVASDRAEFDLFGTSLALDNSVIIVGAHGKDRLPADNAGAAYVFEKNTLGDFVETAKLYAEKRSPNDRFGMSVDIDGNTIVVGADGTDTMLQGTGVVYLFEKPIHGWSNTAYSAKLTASDASTFDFFGKSVAISGNTVVASADRHDSNGLTDNGAIYLFEKSLTGWRDMNQTAKLTSMDANDLDHLGRQVDISGNIVVTGAHYDDNSKGTNAGALYLYEKPASGWKDMTESMKFTASNGANNDSFGYSVSISGTSIVSIAPYGVGGVYHFSALKDNSVLTPIIMYLLN